jgi:hypothetical protein
VRVTLLHIFILFFCLSKGQNLNCDSVKAQLSLLNDSSINVIFGQGKDSKIVLVGSNESNNNSRIFSELIRNGIKFGYNTVVFDQPASRTLLFEELLKDEKINKKKMDEILKWPSNPKDFKKTILDLFEINKKKKLKIICVDIESSLYASKITLLKIFDEHKNSLSQNYKDLFDRVSRHNEKNKDIGCIPLFKEIIDLYSQNKYVDDNSLGNDFYLFKGLIESAKLNSLITGTVCSNNQIDEFMAGFLIDVFKAEKQQTKILGFVGFRHAKLIADFHEGERFGLTTAANLVSKYVKTQSVMLAYKNSRNELIEDQKMMFNEFYNCLNSVIFGSRSNFIYAVDREKTINKELRNYSFILYH